LFRAYSEKADTHQSETTLQFSLTCPHECIIDRAGVASVNIPAIAGDLCVLGGTGATITELNAGLVTVRSLSGETSQYFISPGFALKSKDRSLVVSVAEAVPVEDLDPAAVDKVINLSFF
jgi:F0F1-type ATP synthase epsilon subunit